MSSWIRSWPSVIQARFAGSIDRYSVRARTSPGPGSGTGPSRYSKSDSLSGPFGRCKSTYWRLTSGDGALMGRRSAPRWRPASHPSADAPGALHHRRLRVHHESDLRQVRVARGDAGGDREVERDPGGVPRLGVEPRELGAAALRLVEGVVRVDLDQVRDGLAALRHAGQRHGVHVLDVSPG